MVDKDMADGTGIFKELVDKGLIGSKSAHLDPAMRIENLRQALQDPANAELNKKLKNNFATVAHENPDLFRAMYPADYKGPYTPDIMLNHLATWQSGKENTNVNSQDMIAELVKEVKKMQLELQTMKEQMAEIKAENAFLRQQLQDVKSGKIKPEDIRLTPDQALEQQPQPKTEQNNEPEMEQPEVSSLEKSDQTPVSPTEERADSKEEKGQEEVKTQKEPIRDLNTLLAQHNLGELRSILGGIDTTDMHQLDLLNKIQQEYENRSQADYKAQDLNQLIQTASDVSFAHRIDNEMDDGVVDKVEVEVPVSEAVAPVETRGQPDSEQPHPEVSTQEGQGQPEPHEEQKQDPEQQVTLQNQTTSMELPIQTQQQPAENEDINSHQIYQVNVQDTPTAVSQGVEVNNPLFQKKIKRTEAEKKAEKIAQQKVELTAEEENLIKRYPNIFASLNDKGDMKMKMRVGDDEKIYYQTTTSKQKKISEVDVGFVAQVVGDKSITAEKLARILKACSQRGKAKQDLKVALKNQQQGR